MCASYYEERYNRDIKVYFIEEDQSIYTFTLHDWWIKNHYSHMYNRHGAKTKVGSVVKSANATNKKWAYAKATGGKNDAFSC